MNIGIGVQHWYRIDMHEDTTSRRSRQSISIFLHEKRQLHFADAKPPLSPFRVRYT